MMNPERKSDHLAWAMKITVVRLFQNEYVRYCAIDNAEQELKSSCFNMDFARLETNCQTHLYASELSAFKKRFQKNFQRIFLRNGFIKKAAGAATSGSTYWEDLISGCCDIGSGLLSVVLILYLANLLWFDLLEMEFAHRQAEQPGHSAYDCKYEYPDRVAPCKEEVPVVCIRPLPYAVDQIVAEIDGPVNKRR